MIIAISKWKLLALVLAAMPACQSASAKSAGTATELVRVGNRTLTLPEAQAQVSALSAERRAIYRTPAERVAYVQSMVDHEVLAVEAESLGYANAPEVLAAAKHAMVVKLLKERIGDGPDAGALEAAARAYYAAHPAEFGPPERAVVAVIRMRDAAQAQTVQAEAIRVVTEAATSADASGKFSAFKGLVTKYTDEQGARDVTLTLDRNLTAYPDAVIRTAAGMREVGEVSTLVSTEAGHFILQLKERLPASVLPFERVKEHAYRSASEELRDKKAAAFAAEMALKHHAEMHAERFAAVKFDAPH